MEDHRKLRVWKQSHEHAVAVRGACRGFQRGQYASLLTQITRAAESVVFNIAEGCGAASAKQFARFLDIAIKSTRELEAQLELAKDYGALKPIRWTSLNLGTISIRRQPCALRARVVASS